MIQLCGYMLNPENEIKILPLPINLAFCRDRKEALNTEPKIEEFSKLLFGVLLEEAQLDTDFVSQELLPEIRRGNIFLFLDGLDELVSELNVAPIQHKNFLTGLNTAPQESA